MVPLSWHRDIQIDKKLFSALWITPAEISLDYTFTLIYVFCWTSSPKEHNISMTYYIQTFYKVYTDATSVNWLIGKRLMVELSSKALVTSSGHLYHL